MIGFQAFGINRQGTSPIISDENDYFNSEQGDCDPCE